METKKPAEMTTLKQMPPRVWIWKCPETQRIHGFAKPETYLTTAQYISLKEHEDILRPLVEALEKIAGIAPMGHFTPQCPLTARDALAAHRKEKP